MNKPISVPVKLQIVTFPIKKVKIKCDVHGVQKLVPYPKHKGESICEKCLEDWNKPFMGIASAWLTEEPTSEGEWIEFKARVFGRHSKLWNYGKNTTISMLEAFISQLLEKSYEKGWNANKKRLQNLENAIVKKGLSAWFDKK